VVGPAVNAVVEKAPLEKSDPRPPGGLSVPKVRVQTIALAPVTARPTIKVFTSRVPS
jgi:hypothetical protein